MLRTTTVGILSSLLVIVSVSVSACSGNSPAATTPAPTVTDTLGTQFAASCSSSMCTLAVQDPSIKPLSCDSAYGSDAFVMLWSRVLTIHVLNVPSAGGSPQVNVAEPGHPVSCTASDQCTPWDATIGNIKYQFVCQNGICQDPNKVLTTSDVITLCQANILWPSTCPYITSQPFAKRLAEIAQGCDANSGQCVSVPADCWQPTPTVDGGIAALDSGAASVDSGF